jgi:hypothetical protein
MSPPVPIGPVGASVVEVGAAVLQCGRFASDFETRPFFGIRVSFTAHGAVANSFDRHRIRGRSAVVQDHPSEKVHTRRDAFGRGLRHVRAGLAERNSAKNGNPSGQHRGDSK